MEGRDATTIAAGVSSEIEQQLRVVWPELEWHALKAFLVEACRQKRNRRHTAGTLRGPCDRRDTIRFLAERGVFPNYAPEDVDEVCRARGELQETGKL